MTKRSVLSAATVGAATLTMVLGQAAAFVAPAGLERPLEPRIGAAPRTSRAVSRVAPRRAAPTKARLAAAGFGHAMWSTTTDVPTRAWGKGVAAPRAVADATVAEAAARAALATHLPDLAPGVALADFALVSNTLRGDVRDVGFRQTYRGLPVQGAQVSFSFKRDRLVMMRSQALPAFQLVAMPVGARQLGRARTAAAAWLTDLVAGGAEARDVGERSILPIVRGRDPHGPVVDYRIVDRVRVHARTQPGEWDVFVDAITGEPVARASRLHWGTSTIQYRVAARWPGSGVFADLPAQQLTHTLGGADALADTIGKVTYGGASASGLAGLDGPLVSVTSDDPLLPDRSISVTDGNTTLWDVGTDSDAQAFPAAAIYGQQVKDFARAQGYLPTAYLDTQLPIFVNEGDPADGMSFCNAYSNLDDIHFFAKGGGCENTGAMADVVFHEYGHSLHGQAIIDGVGNFDSGVSEGMGDFISANITGDAGLGRGFMLTDDPLRDLDPVGDEAVWPDDEDFDPHVTGLIIAGALWDLRKALVLTEGEAEATAITAKIQWGIMARSTDIPSTYAEALLADDDDGDLGNGTPHLCAIDLAFGAHGLADSSVLDIVGTPLADGLTITVPVVPPADPPPVCALPEVVSGELSWRLREDPSTNGTVALAETATGWTGALPAPATDGVIEYQVSVTLSSGNTRRFPENDADPYYQAYAGEVTPVWCANFDALPDDWTLTGEWEWATPGDTVGAGDPATAFTGAKALGIDLSNDGFYDVSTADTATTPTIDIAGFTGLRLQYRRWLGVEDSIFDHATISLDGNELWRNTAGGGSTQHVDREWRFQDLALPVDASATSLQLAFGLTSDEGLEFGGWTVDDVCVVATGGSAVPACGDGTMDDGETCDDGNTVDGDGCSAACQTEGGGEDDAVDDIGGGCCQTGSSSTGAIVLGLATLGLAFAPRRRRRRA